MSNDIRKLKWVGDPPMLLEDQQTVAVWKHEVRRAVAMPGCTRTCAPPAPNNPGFPGLSKTYVFGKTANKRAKATVWDLILNVDSIDAEIIMRLAPDEFKDVTDDLHPELVKNEPFIVRKEGSKYKKYRAARSI